MSTSFVIRPTVVDDCPEILRLIKELASFENLTDRVKMNAETLKKDGFGDHPLFRCVVAEQTEAKRRTGKLVGYGLHYIVYSTFDGRCMWLEDLYVSPEFRRRGVASEILRYVAKAAVDEDCSRIDFVCLAWNERAMNMYRNLGAVDMTSYEQRHCLYLLRDDIKRLAAGRAARRGGDIDGRA